MFHTYVRHTYVRFTHVRSLHSHTRLVEKLVLSHFVAYTIHEIFIESDLKNKTSKNNRPPGTVRSATQNETVPEEGKIHRTYTIHEIFIESDLKKNFKK